MKRQCYLPDPPEDDGSWSDQTMTVMSRHYGNLMVAGRIL